MGPFEISVLLIVAHAKQNLYILRLKFYSKTYICSESKHHLIMLTNKPTLFTQQSKYEHPNVYMSLNIIMNQRQLEILWSYVFQFDF